MAGGKEKSVNKQLLFTRLREEERRGGGRVEWARWPTPPGALLLPLALLVLHWPAPCYLTVHVGGGVQGKGRYGLG